MAVGLADPLQELPGTVLRGPVEDLLGRPDLADHAGVQEAHPVADLAGEGHLVRGHEDGHSCGLQTPDDVLDQVPKLQTEFEYVIADGPAGLSEVTRAIFFVADLIVLPCGPSVLDLRAATDAIRILNQVRGSRKGPPDAVLVPNKLQVQYRLSQELLATTQTFEIPTTCGLRLRQAYADAAGQGTVVWKLGTKSAQEAGFEIEELFQELMKHEHTNEKDNGRSA